MVFKKKLILCETNNPIFRTKNREQRMQVVLHTELKQLKMCLEQKGGKKWFAFESKSFEIEVEEAKKGLRGCIWERRKGINSWIIFGGRSLTPLLMGLEDCVRATRVSILENVWEEEGR